MLPGLTCSIATDELELLGSHRRSWAAAKVDESFRLLPTLFWMTSPTALAACAVVASLIAVHPDPPYGDTTMRPSHTPAEGAEQASPKIKGALVVPVRGAPHPARRIVRWGRSAVAPVSCS